ncbi:MAG TPA: tetratricopeptide repeat protein, partial [Chthonomonadales bacterium]|nr:tetratricopeptide repeat protein [Chthonomonadales bacterium]
PRGWLANLYARLGFAYMDQQRMSDARNLFEIGVAIYPKSPDANEGLGECAYFSKDYPAAVRALSMAVAINPELISARNRLAQTYAAMGEWRKARDQYRLVLKSMDWTGQVYIELAKVEMKLGDYAAAARTLEQALRRAPYRPDIEEMLARIYRDHLRRSEFPAKIHIDTSTEL